jgi:pyruvate formate lyase activating enzyme
MIARAGSRRSALCVGGFVPFTATDYPGALAAVVFCQGCPWRCGYCHNPHLLPADGDGERRFDEIVDWLASRRGLLDAVVFSGGEPTAQPALVDAIAAVRERGFKVGLHTAGAYPRRLAQWLSRIDWVGIDIKARAQDYEAVTGAMRSGEAAWTSLECIVDAGRRLRGPQRPYIRHSRRRPRWRSLRASSPRSASFTGFCSRFVRKAVRALISSLPRVKRPSTESSSRGSLDTFPIFGSAPECKRPSRAA